ncbi:hypothetical protein [Brevundimonas sp.]|uniref:hypothetical protein n=1 Tax=Brevundimonas sp. TaxID=1871086 RepID=UPI0035B12EFB
MTPARPQVWSLSKSLAFLAATFAIVFGSLMPAAVAASPATGQAIILCSGDRLDLDEDGHPADEAERSLSCAMALLGGLGAPLPPVVDSVAPSPVRYARLIPASAEGVPPPARAPPRPHSTAPPPA